MHETTKSRKWLLALGYLVFGSIAFIGFFYVTFPFKMIQQKMVQAFETRSDCQVDVGSRSVAIPLHFKWKQVFVACPVGLPFKIESIEAKIALLPLLLEQKGDITFRIRMGENNGEIVGHLMADATPDGVVFSLKEEGVGLNLGKMGLSGTLNMKGEGRWIKSDVLHGTGLLKLTVDGVNIQSEEWMAPLDRISFSVIRGEMAWQNGRVSISELSAEGEHVDFASSRGDLLLTEPVSGSLISIVFKITPKGDFKRMATLLIPGYSGKEPLTLDIQGAIDEPIVLINGKRMPTFS